MILGLNNVYFHIIICYNFENMILKSIPKNFQFDDALDLNKEIIIFFNNWNLLQFYIDIIHVLSKTIRQLQSKFSIKISLFNKNFNVSNCLSNKSNLYFDKNWVDIIIENDSYINTVFTLLKFLLLNILK